MASATPTFVRANPSFVLPELILQYQQLSGAFELFAGGSPMVKLGSEDQYVYARRADVRTKSHISQAAVNSLPSCEVVFNEISTPTYLLQTRAEYNHHDTAAFSNYGASIVDAYRLAMRQAIFQDLRNLALYGKNPANGEGLINTPGATATTLPADSNGNTSITTYDNGQLALFFLTLLGAIKVRTNQGAMPVKFSIVMPQRTYMALNYQGIVQLTNYQRPGAGVASIAGMVDGVAGVMGDEITWGVDDTLIGKGAGGTDAIVIVMPEVKKPEGGTINTNEFAKLSPGMAATTLMLMDKAAPTEIPTPIAGGAIDVLSELRATSGWGIRPEAITILSATY